MKNWWSEWKDIVLLTLGFLLSIVGAFIGAWIQRLIDTRSQSRPLSKILNFSSSEILFVFPRRDHPSGKLLPQTATEDFMAMNNFISALIKRSWAHGFGFRDFTNLRPHDKKQNLVVICSISSNEFAKELQDALQKQHLGAYFFTRVRDELCITNAKIPSQPPYSSPSWETEKTYKLEGIPGPQLPAKRFTDLAIITKVSNPWNVNNKVVWIAGIRGIGTWGAAECIKKHWRQLYDKLPEDSKNADFSALIEVEYNNLDIENTRVVDLLVFSN